MYRLRKERLLNHIKTTLVFAVLALAAIAQYPLGECVDCYNTRTEGTGDFHIGVTGAAIIGTGPFGLDIVGSVIEMQNQDMYSITNFRTEQEYLWGFEAGGFLRLPDGERIEILTTFANTSAGLIATYTEPQPNDSLTTFRTDSLHVSVTEITPKMRFSAALPYGLEPYIAVGLTADIFSVDESYRVLGTYYDSQGGEFNTTFDKTTDISISGLELMLGTKVRITNNLAFHLDASGVFMPNKNISLGDINNTVIPNDQSGNPRDPQEISVIPREHRMRLTHGTVRFGVEVSVDMLAL